VKNGGKNNLSSTIPTSGEGPKKLSWHGDAECGEMIVEADVEGERSAVRKNDNRKMTK